MKIVCVAILMFAVVLPAYGQTRERHEVGLSLGPTLTNIEIKDGPELDARVAATVGVFYRHRFANRWSLDINPSLERKGYKITMDRTDEKGVKLGEFTDYSNYDYLILPLLLQYEREHFFVNGGGYIAHLFRQRYNYELDEMAQAPRDFTHFYRRKDFGFAVGVGLRWALSNDLGLNVQVRHSRSLHNISNQSTALEQFPRSTALIFGLGRSF